MALIQKPAATAREVDLGRPLDIAPHEVAEMDEEAWYAQVYRGDQVPQLTVRAVAMGSFLGFLLGLTNLYMGLKIGLQFGVAITACILSYALWNAAVRAGVAKTPMSILENNCMQSTASSAGLSTGGTMVSAIAALLMLSATDANPQGSHLSWPVLTAWTVCVAVLGVVFAIPIKRGLINRQRLTFPSGVAAASTLQSLYSAGQKGARQARALLYSAAVASLVPILVDLRVRPRAVPTDGGGTRTTLEPVLPASVDVFDGWLPAVGQRDDNGETHALAPSDWTMTWDVNPVMIAVGALVGLRVAVYMLAGALVLAYVAGPIGLEAAWTRPDGTVVHAVSHSARAWKELGIWLGAPMMVASGVWWLAFRWRTAGRAWRAVQGQDAPVDGRARQVEVPMSWFAMGTVLAGSGITLLAWHQFDVPIVLGALAVVLTFALALVAAQATGESDVTPAGPMGKVMQLVYGVLIPQSATANLMTAGITAGAAVATADLLTELKSGYLLGADPRRQFLAQLAGIASGAVATVGGFYLLVPDATALTGIGAAAPAFPAPGAEPWLAVAVLFRDGLANMHPVHQQAIALGLLVGTLAAILERALPAHRAWLPSATGLGLGFLLPFQYPLSMFVGAVLATLWTRRLPQSAGDYLFPVASGVIAGISVMGVLVAGINTFVLTH